ncbi:MAG TPA: hypothetical protein VF286_00415 [Acidiphilium sp.]
MRAFLMTGAALMLMSGVALAQNTTNGTAASGQGGMTSTPMQPSSGQAMGMSNDSGSNAYISHKMGGPMPYNASAGTYLNIAEQAVMSHDQARAHVALGRAETVLLTNSYVQGTVNGPISSPAISAIRDARQAVDGGQYQQASSLIHKVMSEMHGGMSHGGMSHGGMSNGGMSNGGMSGSGMSNGGMSHSGMSNGGMSGSGMSNGGMSAPNSGSSM